MHSDIAIKHDQFSRSRQVQSDVQKITEAQPKHISIVIPAYNEDSTIELLIRKIVETLSMPDINFDILVINDGSVDGTAQTVKRMIKEGLPMRLINLSRNFGKENALTAGLDCADADAVVLMDADLQHPVELLPRFLDNWRQGYEIVYGFRENRRDESWCKRGFTRIFYSLLNNNSEVYIEPGALDFRLLDRRVVEVISSLPERVRFMKGLYSWVGFQTVGVPFSPDKRYAGRTRFDYKNLFRLGWDGLTSFSDLPLRLMSVGGAIVSILSLSYALFIFARTLILGTDLPGWATLTVAITFLCGVQLLSLGIIGRYIRNIFIETKRRPNYIVAEEISVSNMEDMDQ